jgi:hypothetical protein
MSNHRQLRFPQRPWAAAAIGVLAVPFLAGVGYAAANSVIDKPKPQIAIPASSIRSAGNPASHHAGDDRVSRATTITTPAPRPSDDNPASHHVGDDRVSRATTITTPAPRPSDDNPVTHDVGDDQALDNVAAHDAVDDHSGLAQTRLTNSGSGGGHGGGNSGSTGGHDDPQPHS